MTRLLLFCVCLLFVLPSVAQESISPGAAQRLVRIIERAAEEPETALEDLERLAQSRGLGDVDRGFIVREQAVLLMQLERYAEARERLRDVLSNKPEDYLPFLRVLLAQLLLIDNRAEEALPLLEAWARHTENPPVSELSLLGYGYLQVQRFEDAVVIFERILDSTDIINDQWYELLAYAYTQSGQAERAVALLDEVIAHDPAQARWWRQLANIFSLVEEFDTSAASLTILDILGGLSYEDSRRLAGLFSMLGMPLDGALILATALEQNEEPAHYDDLMLLGELYLLAREVDSAIAMFESASALAEDGEPALKIAQLRLQWERYPEARQALFDAIADYGEDAPEQAWYLLAIVEINLDNMEGALEAIDRIDANGAYAERVHNLNQFVENRLAAVSP